MSNQERIEALKAQVDAFRFDPSQKRDGHGRWADGPGGGLSGKDGGKVLAKPSDWLTHVKKSRKPGTPVAISDDGHARLVESDDNAGSHDPGHRDLRLETRNSTDGPWKSTGQYFPKNTISRKRHVLDDYTPGALWKAAGDDDGDSGGSSKYKNHTSDQLGREIESLRDTAQDLRTKGKNDDAKIYEDRMKEALKELNDRGDNRATRRKGTTRGKKDPGAGAPPLFGPR